MRRGLQSAVAWRVAALTVLCASWSSPALSHEVRPAFLQIEERANNYYDILWKQPRLGTMAVRLVPHISGGLLEQPPSAIELGPDFQIRLWSNVNAGAQGLGRRTLRIEGLEQTITDVPVSIVRANGDSSHQILRPQDPGLTFDLHTADLPVPAYITLGTGHILTGVDHLSLILGLLLLVRHRMTLIKTITAFTVAHSITLAATTLHVIAVQPSVIELLVALSILFVAVELVHSYRGRNGLTVRYPWLIAFIFGLLHGFAFAGALGEVGLPPDAIPLSLLLFNIGVELGQLLFIVVVFSIGWALTQLPKELSAWTHWLPPYAIGSFAAFWFLEQLSAELS